MKKIRSYSSFYILAFTQVTVSTAILAYMEFALNRLGFTATGSWEFYAFHLLFLLPCVLLLTPAGFFSDKYPKEKVLSCPSLRWGFFVPERTSRTWP